MEKDDELKGEGNSLDFGFRMYDSRVGRFLSLDPDKKLYPELSPFSYGANSPILLIDELGRGPIIPEGLWRGKPYDVAFVAGFIDGFWNAAESMTKHAVDWHPLNWVTDPKNQWKKTKEAIQLTNTLFKIATDETARENVIKAIEEGIGTWIEDATGKKGVDVAGYTHGKLVFEVVATFIGVEELQLASSAGKFSKETLNLLKKNAKTILKKLKPCGCFTAGTQVFTEEGYKNIEDIKVGDKVWAFDELTGKLELKEVIDTFTRTFNQIYKIYTEDEIIDATHEHPFFIGGRWLKVEELKTGDLLTLYDGSSLMIDKIEVVEGNFTVHNFIVDKFHNYFVTLEKVLVHNGNPCPWNEIKSDFLTVAKYKFKHYVNSAKDIWRQVIKSTLSGPSKFKGTVEEVDKLILKAWDEGKIVNNGKKWKVYESDEVIGAVSGKETKYMRVEFTEGTNEVHASPITEAQYLKLTK